MPTHASKINDVRRFISLCCAIGLLTGTASGWAASPKKGKQGTASQTTARVKSGSSATTARPAQPQGSTTRTSVSPQTREWGPYLDVAYELTYWDKAEIKEWREKRDQEFGVSLTSFIATWNSRLTAAAPEKGATDAAQEQVQLHRERDYLRLAIAHTIDYLQSDNRESLTAAVTVMDKLKGKSSMPEIAFWTGYMKALQALENRDSDQFVTQVYDIWNNAILFIEQNEIARSAQEKSAATSTPYYYRNLINLVVDRAIIARKQENLNALGPLFLMMKERNLGEKDGEGKYTTTLVQRITDSLTAPDSDRYRLNFSVAIIESKRQQQIAAAKLDSEGMSAGARKAFEQAREYNDLAFKWAASRRSSGVVQAAVDHLDSTSFAIQRLADNEKAPEYKFFSSLPDHEGASALINAMAIYNDIATLSAGGWERAGYESRELYVKSTHRLWRAIMELSLWTGDYYLAKLNGARDSRSIHACAAPMQVALDSYLDFLASQLGRGFDDIIPDSAYFGAAEAAEKLAFAYQKVNAFSTDNSAYNLWFLHRLQATELFPLAPREVRQTAAVLKQDGRYNLFLDYFLPLATRVRQSPAIRQWIETQPPTSVATIRSYVDNIDRLFAGGADGAGTASASAPESAFTPSFQALREELQRKPEHPVHKLLKAFYLEELKRTSSFTLLMKDSNRLDHSM
jgi:hypothetical protein